MAYILKDTHCSECNSKYVAVIFFKETDYNSQYYGQEIVSHGICVECCNQIVLPSELKKDFIENCVINNNF